MRSLGYHQFMDECDKILNARENVLISVPQLDGVLDAGEWVYGLIYLDKGFPCDTALSIYRVPDFKIYFGGPLANGALQSILLMSDDVQMFCLVLLNRAYSANLIARKRTTYEDIALEFAAFLLGGINFVTTVVNERAPGMGLFDMPIFVWEALIATREDGKYTVSMRDFGNMLELVQRGTKSGIKDVAPSVIELYTKPSPLSAVVGFGKDVYCSGVKHGYSTNGRLTGTWGSGGGSDWGVDG